MADPALTRRFAVLRPVRLALGALALLIAGCSGAGESQVWRGQQHDAEGPACVLIESGAQWDEAWAQVGEDPPMEWPGGRAVGVLFLDKSRPSGGYRPELEGVADGEVRVRVTPPDGPATTVISQPWLITVVPEGGVSRVTCRTP
ncbi:protease complex subunit PrcB family protein [Halorhodospira halophila]|uniref:PrcB C-terminal domain-containing protein n=1 Tax=Halorhodospira halophila (strain DSM 244 / SL1) TaxID=349124 RepID=A1WZL8_HALHL|nr:protease complex subunit PrcB family protein [Halorhodospira halophila]ABM63130.1 hypothetical protein Hhal_2367 [Halorhodospira halophila SL1]MBK1729309.1 hypothetical protein [Halorhodospira halophila]